MTNDIEKIIKSERNSLVIKLMILISLQLTLTNTKSWNQIKLKMDNYLLGLFSYRMEMKYMYD